MHRVEAGVGGVPGAVARRRVALMKAVGMLSIVVLGACARTEEPAPQQESAPATVTALGAPKDPLSTPVTIHGNYAVTPWTVRLSKNARSRAQWQNNAADSVMILLVGGPIGELVPPGGWSTPVEVCLDCPNGDYDYKVYHRVAGRWTAAVRDTPAPGEPAVNVGD